MTYGAGTPPGYRKAKRIHAQRPEAIRRADERQTARRVTQDVDKWRKAPGRMDYPHVDTGPEFGRKPDEGWAEALARQSQIAEPHRKSPRPKPDQVAKMAGYGSERGYDAMQGVDAMVLGHADATEDMKAESATAGGPLDLSAEETQAYQDLHGRGSHGIGMSAEEKGDDMDWTGWM